jgi:hypothetical protein
MLEDHRRGQLRPSSQTSVSKITASKMTATEFQIRQIIYSFHADSELNILSKQKLQPPKDIKLVHKLEPSSLGYQISFARASPSFCG